MAIGPRLDLRQSQSLVMTPQLQQAIKLLALSNLELETVVAEAIADNPLLEVGEAAPVTEPVEFEPGDMRRTHLESSPVDQLIGEGRATDDRPLDIDGSALDRDRDTGDGAGNTGERASRFELERGGESGGSGEGSSEGGGQGLALDERGGGGPTLAEHLHAQAGSAARDLRQAAIAHWLIDQLDEAGYLETPLREIADLLGLPLNAIEDALGVVQSLDPTGVGARSLSECLALQAIEADRHDPCMKRLIENLDLVAKGAFAQLKRMCGVDDEDFADMLAELRSYDPRPGLRFGSTVSEAVTPDILIRARAPDKDGYAGWDIALNQATLPRLVVNRSYYVELKRTCGDKESRGWLGDKLADANWLMKALDQRQKTILKVAAEIVKQQDGFFRRGVSQLKPLTLRTVAEAIEMHESTVSRVTSNKYLNCDRGTFELKYFFTSGVARVGASGEAGDGKGTVSAETVKAQIRALIEVEELGAILSDDTLVELLRAKGFELARRTVAKYREAIGLGSSVQRRRQKTLAGVR